MIWPNPGQRVVFLHAHPDDETLSTGAMIVELVRRGHPVAVVTATRGEQGQIRPGNVPGLADTPTVDAGASTPEPLVAHRERELTAALEELGVRERAFLGSPPARAEGMPARRYRDSGMTWLTPTLAGPSRQAGPDSLSAADLREPAADLVAYLQWFAADLVISYDHYGGYGHPDHVACHQVAKLAHSWIGIPMLEVVSEPLLPDARAEQFSLAAHLQPVRRALACYRSQLELDGDEVVHVGGQRHPVMTSLWLRRAGAPDD